MAHARIGELAMLPTATAPGHARRWLHEALATVELDDDTVQLVVLVVDELVTNAVIHAGTPIDVRVQHDSGIVHCVVSDRRTDGPLPRIIETADGRGRGLRLVDVVARRCRCRSRHRRHRRVGRDRRVAVRRVGPDGQAAPASATSD